MSLLAVILLSTIAISAARYGCKDPQGKDVDWWVVYKMPKVSGAESPIAEGYGHYYMDASTSGWQKGSSLADKDGHAIVETLKQLYAAKAASGEQFIAMHNDDWPAHFNVKSNTNYGHTKGNLVSDKEGGYWMIHSTPRFPSDEAYEWPTSATNNGQSFLCISFNYDQLVEISKQLTYNQPWIYFSKLTPGIEADCPELRNVINKKFVSAAPFSRTSCLVSRGGMQFTSFAKHENWQNDLYYSVIAATLKTNVYVETWINGATAKNKNLPSWCGNGFKVINITQITIDGNSFTTTKDHSKWAVAEDCTKEPWICIGDINRQESQYDRGGGAVCFKHQTICKNYRSVIAKSIDCNSGGDPPPQLGLQPSIDHQCPVNVQLTCADYSKNTTFWCTKARRTIVEKTCGTNICYK